MKIIISDLYGPNGFNYSNEVEEYLGNILARQFGKRFSQDHSAGYHPQYDFKLDDYKIENKITSKSLPEIEYCRANGDPSGLLTSESNYYHIISSGGSKGRFVGKIRLYKTFNLRKSFISYIHDPNNANLKTSYGVNGNSPGSICFRIDPKIVPHIWVGDCEIIYDGSRIAGYDMTTFVSNNYSKLV